ncbi:electron transport complex subunit RsxC [Marinicellulosiphila megalodicopiae]|uniref:electron transport complex subunit RsxC n=1 Tax=Marinicellulosiphila megalodicopiae TaxID=2724896 RepID=UPI003BB093B2
MSQVHKVYPLQGGVHPPENKDQSNQTAIQTGPIPNELVLPLSQHIGAPSKVLVNVGQTVLKGELIASADGFVSANVHAPTSGVIKAIEERPIVHPSSMKATCIVLAPDQNETWIDRHPVSDYRTLSACALVEMIQLAGITGMGGAGFPTHVKYPKDSSKIDTLIINATECEPYITADDRLMRERAQSIVTGIEICQHILQVKDVFIGIEDNKPEAIQAMQEAVKNSLINNITVRIFPTKYPSGGEKQLIHILTGKEVPKGGLPNQIGIVCQNIGTVYAIYDAVMNDHPLISRITTVTGDAGGSLGNYEILMGTPIKALLSHVKWEANQAERVIIGGPMMGFTADNLSAPLIKNANCLLVPKKKELPKQNPANPCIRCGQCEQVCPAGLLPQQLHWYAKNDDLEKAKLENLADCIECGACSFVCPSHIPLVQFYRYAKGKIREEDKAHEESERAKGRFEARQARLDAEAAVKEAKRQARADKAALSAKAKTTGSAPDADLIAKARAKVAASKAPVAKTDTATLEANLKTALEKVEKTKARIEESKISEPDMAGALEIALGKFIDKANKAQVALDEAKAGSNSAQSFDPKTQPALNADAFECLDSLQAKANKAEEKLEKAKQRLADVKDSEPEKVDMLTTSLEKFAQKAKQAQEALQAFQAPKQEAQTTPVEAEPVLDLESIQLSYDQAKEKHEKAAVRLEHAKQEKPHLVEGLEKNVSAFLAKAEALKVQLDAALASDPEAKQKMKAAAQDKVAKAEKKLATMQQKLEDAKANNPDLIPAFEKSVATMQGKLDVALAQLNEDA